MADKKVSELSAITNLSGDDLLLVVNDPSGTPTSNKVTLTNMFANVVPNIVHKGTFTNRANTTFTGTAMTVSSNATFSGTLNVTGTLVESGTTQRSGVFINSGNAIINGTTTANGSLKFTGSLISDSTIVVSTNGKIHANNAISDGTITERMTSFANNLMQVANTTALVNDRMQVSNTNTLVNDRMQVANTTALVNDRLQVANAAQYLQVANASLTLTTNTLVLTSNVGLILPGGGVEDQVPGTANAESFGLPAGSIWYSNNHFYIAVDSYSIKKVELYTDEPIHATFSITNNGTSAYRFSGAGAALTDNQTLYLYKGFTYKFVNTTGATHPFQILNTAGGSAFSNGVSGSQSGTQLFTVPHAQQSNLVYQCSIHSGMQGTLVIVS